MSFDDEGENSRRNNQKSIYYNDFGGRKSSALAGENKIQGKIFSEFSKQDLALNQIEPTYKHFLRRSRPHKQIPSSPSPIGHTHFEQRPRRGLEFPPFRGLVVYQQIEASGKVPTWLRFKNTCCVLSLYPRG